MAHQMIPSSPTSVTELEEEVAPERGLKGAPAEPSSSIYATALEEEVALGRWSLEEDDEGRNARGRRLEEREEAGLGEPRVAAGPG